MKPTPQPNSFTPLLPAISRSGGAETKRRGRPPLKKAATLSAADGPSPVKLSALSSKTVEKVNRAERPQKHRASVKLEKPLANKELNENPDHGKITPETEKPGRGFFGF